MESTLGEVCEIISAKRIFAKEYQAVGIPFFRGKEVTEKYIFSFAVWQFG
jgi:type I restriction enzyme S subunit